MANQQSGRAIRPAGRASKTAAATVDLMKEHKAEYAAARNPSLVLVGAGRYLAIDGEGEPGGAEFQAAIEALYALAWALKMTRRFGGLDDFKVGALEGIYLSRREWTLLLRVPSFVTKTELKKTAAGLVRKGKAELVRRVELRALKEGRCAQVLQVGPYELIARTVEDLERFGRKHGLACAGPLHEIYLSDPRRVAPAKIRTIVRRPVRRAE